MKAASNDAFKGDGKNLSIFEPKLILKISISSVSAPPEAPPKASIIFEVVLLDPPITLKPTTFEFGATPLTPILFPPTADVNPAIEVP